jgi:ABC-type Na+ efflux pump permease subunit
MWQTFGKTLIVVGVVLAALGVLMLFGGRIPFLGKLPGDIHVRRANFTFYFPLTTCVLVSLVLTLIVWLISKFRR